MRVYLRALEPEDYLKTYEWRQDDDIQNILGGNRFFVSKEREKQWAHFRSIDDSKGIYLAICLKENNEMIGYCSIINIDLRNLKAEYRGIIIGDPNNRGKGYGKEAQILMLKYCFEELPLHKIYAYSLAEHKETEKMMKSLGFQIDGVLRDEVFKNDEFKSYTIYSMLKNEYEAIYHSNHK